MITREQLYQLVWTESGQQVARHLGVSGSYLGRICTALDIPRPPRGWWARKQVGRATAPPPLPSARPGHPMSWSKSGTGTAAIWRFHHHRDLLTKSRWDGVHPLVAYAAKIFASAKTASDGTFLITRAAHAIDVTTSPEALDRALAFANALFTALEDRGHYATVASRSPFIRPPIDQWDRPPLHLAEPILPVWTPLWPTIATIAGVPLGLAILEIHEEVKMQYAGHGQFVPISLAAKKRAPEIVGIIWTEWRRMQTGRLKLVAYSPIHSVRWQTSWRLGAPQKCIDEIGGIVTDLERAASSLAGLPDAPGNREPSLPRTSGP